MDREAAPGAIGLPRRLYRPTGYGLRVLAAWEARRARWRVRQSYGTPDDPRVRAPSRCRSHLQPKTLERVVEPAIADLQREYAGCNRARRFRRVPILAAGYLAILEVMLMCALETTPATDNERKLLARTLAWSCLMVVCASALLIVPPFLGFSPAFRKWYAVLTVAPQAVPLAIPIGLAFGVAFGLSSRLTRSAAKMVLLGALSASLLSFVILAWAMPAGNRAFNEFSLRELKFLGFEGQTDKRLRGDSEMTLPELRAESVRWSAQGEPNLARQFAFRFHFRFALAVAALALVSVVLASPIDHRAARGVFAFAACLAYWALMYMGELAYRKGYAAPPLAAWLPNLAFIAVAVVFASSRASRLRGSWNTAT